MTANNGRVGSRPARPTQVARSAMTKTSAAKDPSLADQSPADRDGPDRNGAEQGACLLAVEDLRVSFDTPRGTLTAVNGVSLSVAAGSTLGVVGESGSGKSVLARAVMNLLPRAATVAPASQIRLRGEDVRHLPPGRARHFWGVDVAMVFQDPMTSLTPTRRVGAQLVEPLRYHLRLSRAEAVERAIGLLSDVGLPEPASQLGRYPHQLSGGMRQRATIAIAIACRPGLLIADEPTTALDVTVQHQILNLLGRLKEQHRMGMILITHDLGVVAGRADQVAVMYAGRVVERGPTRSLFRHTTHPYTKALLDSIPKLGDAPHTPLTAIPGRPPDPINAPPGCAFAPRCAHATDRCRREIPLLRAASGPGHVAACFHPLGGTSA
jgi:peptide/nickel transport system ATP-binding protein